MICAPSDPAESAMKTTAKSKLAEQRAQYDAWYDKQVRLGLEDIEAGRIVSHDEVVKRSAELLLQLWLHLPGNHSGCGCSHCRLAIDASARKARYLRVRAAKVSLHRDLPRHGSHGAHRPRAAPGQGIFQSLIPPSR
jgi:hypothetical protein